MELLIISKYGRYIRLPAHVFPTLDRNARGVSMIRLPADDEVLAIIPVAENEGGFLTILTKKGKGKKVDLMEFKTLNPDDNTDKIIEEGDEIATVSYF